MRRIEPRHWSGEGNENRDPHPNHDHHLPPEGCGIPFPYPFEPRKRAPVQVGETDWETQGQATDEKLQDYEQRKSLPLRGLSRTV